jgi:hypothetical protein
VKKIKKNPLPAETKGVLGPSVGYVDLLDHYTTEHLKREDEKGRDKTPIRPSAAGYCTRELYYALMEFHGKASYKKELREPAVHRLLNLGHSIEWHLIKQFELLSTLVDIRYKQQVLSFKYMDVPANPSMSQWLEGSLDLVFWNDKWKCVADVKSKGGGHDFRARKSRWDSYTDKLLAMKTVEPIAVKSIDKETGQPRAADSFWVEDLEAFLEELDDPFFAANFLQLNMYACSDFLRQRGIDHGAIIQYHKADSKLREVRFRPSLKLYTATLNKFQTALDAAAMETASAAPQDHAQGSYKCRYCPYKAECWGKKGNKK